MREVIISLMKIHLEVNVKIKFCQGYNVILAEVDMSTEILSNKHSELLSLKNMVNHLYEPDHIIAYSYLPWKRQLSIS